MKSKTNMVYFLDNSEISIVEIENEAVGLIDILWIIYYKNNNTTKLFKFRHSGSLRIQERDNKRGFFQGSKDKNKYYIEIDNLVVPFKEKTPELIPEKVRSQISIYLNSFIL